MRTTVLAVVVALMSLASAAQASTVTTTVKVTGAGFTAYSGNPVPADPVVGVFTFALDPTKVYTNQTAGLTVHSLNIAYAGPITWDYNGHGGVTIGGDSGVTSEYWGTDDFYLTFQLIDTPGYSQGVLFSYTSHTVVDYFETRDVTVENISPTPIPASLPLFVSALGGLGFAGWRRKRTSAA